jgi:hypothetical protein
MARRSKAEGTLILLAVVVGLPIYFIGKLLAVTGWAVPLAGLIAIVVIIIGVRGTKHRQRLNYLRSKYPEAEVQRILAKTLWQGQTDEQLTDTLGHPAAVDRKVLKTIRREVWKYGRMSAQRYRLRVTVEDGYVIGWDYKS